jgi:hypothetical protein
MSLPPLALAPIIPLHVRKLVHRRCRFRNVYLIEQGEQKPRLIERPHKRADEYPRWQFHVKLGH